MALRPPKEKEVVLSLLNTKMSGYVANHGVNDLFGNPNPRDPLAERMWTTEYRETINKTD